MSDYNLKNYAEKPADDKDNKYHFTGTVYFADTAYSAAEMKARLDLIIVFSMNSMVVSYSAPGAIAVAGKASIAGGTGLAMTLAAPVQYGLCDINVLSLASGNVVVTCAAGVTFDGTNNTATFNAAADRLVIDYKSATQWEIFLNNSVVLSLV